MTKNRTWEADEGWCPLEQSKCLAMIHSKGVTGGLEFSGLFPLFIDNKGYHIADFQNRSAGCSRGSVHMDTSCVYVSWRTMSFFEMTVWETSFKLGKLSPVVCSTGDVGGRSSRANGIVLSRRSCCCQEVHMRNMKSNNASIYSEHWTI